MTVEAVIFPVSHQKKFYLCGKLSIMKILMVCLGNICRSPMAEGILQAKADAKGLNWQVDSAGTSSWHVGEKPHSGSIKMARQNGIDITAQRSRQLKGEDLKIYDLIYAMDTSNYNNIIPLAETQEERDKVKMILNESFPGQNRSVPDPYFQTDGFPSVFALLNDACEKIIERYS